MTMLEEKEQQQQIKLTTNGLNQKKKKKVLYFSLNTPYNKDDKCQRCQKPEPEI